MARGAGADRGAAAHDVRAPAGAPLQVRGGLVGAGRGDPGHARSRADRGRPPPPPWARSPLPCCGASSPCCAPRSPAHGWARIPRNCTTCGWPHAACAAALSLFEGVLPVRAQVFREELGWLARLLGAVRDLDVQLENLAGMSFSVRRPGPSLPTATAATPWPSWRRSSKRERETARADMLQGLDSVRWDRLAKGLTAMAQQGPARRSLATRVPAVIGLPELVLTRHEKVHEGRQAGQAVGRRDRLPRAAHPLQTAALRPRVQQ